MGKKGFTLTELVIVLAMLSTLTAIAVPIFSMYRTRAHNTAALSDLKNVRTLLELYYQEHQQYP
jgi:prepilin-type N-terminal cleavage/methylation domain-containing protein